MLNLVRNLAVLYMALAHTPDQYVHQNERRTIAYKLRSWLPEMDPKLIENVVREVAMDFESGVSEHDLEAAIQELTVMVDEDTREVVVKDLYDIAEADRIVHPEEVAFVQHLAGRWRIPASSN